MHSKISTLKHVNINSVFNLFVASFEINYIRKRMAHATIFRSAISSISFGFSKLAERELNGLDSMPLVAGDDTFRTSSGDFDDSE